jgi:S1-C subfamily serine protease
VSVSARSSWIRGVLAAAVLAALALLHPARPADAADLGSVANAVVKLYVTHQPWNPKQPWSKAPAARRTCSGFVIEQGILTNAHCIMDDTFIQIEVPGLADKIEVERVALNHQVDLALVRPKPPAILPADIVPIRFGDLPEQREKVVTIGYSVGGRQVSYTEGVVSRIDVMPYAHSNLPNLLVQTDAAINRGNSGGPVFSDRSGECLGVATQRFSGSIGYFIPVPVIRQFLTDFEDGQIRGVPYLGLHLQLLENPTLRDYLGMKPGQSGARISKISADSAGPLREGDVLMSVGGTQIFNDGRIPFREFGRIGLGYEISTRQIGDVITFSVLRDGEEIEVEVELTGGEHSIIPAMPLYDEQPPYVVAGGLLFQTVEPGYLGSDVPFNLRRYFGALRGEEEDIEELVIISTIFEADLNKGYDNVQENVRVITVNDRKITRLQDVVEALRGYQGKYHVIELDNRHLIVLDRARVEDEELAIRRQYRIP